MLKPGDEKLLGSNFYSYLPTIYLLITKKKTGDTAFTNSSVFSLMMGQSDIVPSAGMLCKGHVTHVLLLTKYLT